MKIYLDMDGTFVDLYDVEGWLDCLNNKQAIPYERAKGLVNLSAMARLLNTLRARGHEICIVSWLARGSSKEYDEAVRQAKLRWLGRHLKSVTFDEVHILPYGTPKSTVTSEYAILFDDEKRNRDEWRGLAIDAKELMIFLKALARV